MRRLAPLLALSLAACAPPTDNEVVFGGVDGVPNSLSFAVVEGSNPSDQTLEITNAGSCELEWALTVETTDTVSWLSATPTSGNVAATSTASTDITVAIDAATNNSLNPGGYTGSITITASCTATGADAVGSPADVSINLTVSANNAVLGLDDESLEFDVPSLTSATWSTMSTAGAPGPRAEAMAAWSGYELYVVGGDYNDGTDVFQLSTGGAYNPSTDTWRSIAPMPIGASRGTAVWAANKLVIIGAYDAVAPVLTPQNAMIYDPETNAWTVSSGNNAAMTGRLSPSCVVTDGDLVYFWGGVDDNDTPITTNPGAIYNPNNDVTSAMPTSGQPTPDGTGECALTGGELIVVSDDQMGRFDLTSNTWDTSALPDWVDSYELVWTGKQILLRDSFDGAIHSWTRTTNQWEEALDYTANVGGGARIAWTGRELVFHGGVTSPGYSAYEPGATAVTPLGDDLTVGDRSSSQTLTWTGDKLLVFGGWTNLASSVHAPGGGVLQ